LTDELERRAAELLDPAVYAFFAAGAGDERALAANRAAFAAQTLRPRTLVDVAERRTATHVLGKEVGLPVLVAPVGFQTLLHPDGELATVRAAARLRTIACTSVVSEAAPAELAAAAPGARLWSQLYWVRDRELSAHLMHQAADAGFEAIVLTVDAPVLGRRDRSVQAGWRFPDAFRIRSTARADGREALTAPELAALLDASLTWRDLEWVAETARLPIVLKGIMTAEDAVLAAEHGAAAVVVSNHGGRQLDAAPSTLSALPEVVGAVGDRLEVLLDGGIRRGWDVLVALALGARAVLVGRLPMWGLATGGADGVEQVLRLIGEEFDNALALCGCRSPAEAAPSLLGSFR
jgi:4-hydroxymandelate oxidase